MKNGFFSVLKKAKIIKELVGTASYNYVDVPVAKVNMGRLRIFDEYGVNKYLRNKEGF